MPKLYLTLPVLVGLLLGMSGCDSQASQEAEAQQHLNAAVAKLQKANAGYIASEAGADTESELSLLAYRQETMDKAFADLNQVKSLNAPDQKIQALCLEAEIYSSSARYSARAAALENAALAGRSTVLLGYLSAMEAATAQSDALQPQTEDQLTKLQAEVDTQTAKRQKLNTEIDSLNSKLSSVKAEAEQFQAKAEDGYAKAQALREKAFVTSGDKMYDLQDQAAELERKAAIESASAESKQVVVDDLEAQLMLDRVQLDTVNKLIAELNGQIQKTRADTERLADASNSAAQAGDNAAKTLENEYNQLMGVFNEVIDQRLQTAAEKVLKSEEALKQASQQARNSEQIKLQLLSTYVEQAHIATSHAAYLRDMIAMTESVYKSVSRVAPSHAASYQQQIQRLTDAEVALRDKAIAAIDTGMALADELAPAGTTPDAGDTETIALKQKDLLNVYKNERL